MAKVLMTVELEYDDALMHGNDPDSVEWFFSEILSGDKGMLELHSNEIGDTVGQVKVISLIRPNA